MVAGTGFEAFLEGCCGSPTVENPREIGAKRRAGSRQRSLTVAPDGYRMATAHLAKRIEES